MWDVLTVVLMSLSTGRMVNVILAILSTVDARFVIMPSTVQSAIPGTTCWD